MELLGMLVVVGGVIYVVERIRPLAERVIERRHPKPNEPVAVPGDLVSLAMLESEEWAQNQLLDGMRAHYDKTQDWNAVRQHYGVGVETRK
jgi:hypothetical protein